MLCLWSLTTLPPQTELLDVFEEKSALGLEPSDAHKDDIGFGRAKFSWAKQPVQPNEGPHNFCLHSEDDVVFHRGAINLIVGPTGSGKTSVLMALLGEMHYIPTGPRAWVSLPRAGGVAYAAQESWVQNATIKVCASVLSANCFMTCTRKTFFWVILTMIPDIRKVGALIEYHFDRPCSHCKISLASVRT